MKKMIISIVAALAVASTLSATDTNQSDNALFCSQMKDSLPGVVTVGTDLFSILGGKDSPCESHTREEWLSLATTAEYAFLLAVNYSTPTLYTQLVSKAKETKTSDVKGLQKLLENGVASGEFVAKRD